MTKKRAKEKMMSLIKAWGIIFLMTMTFVIYIVASKTSINYEVYAVHEGYGYRINKGEKVMIEQNFIPTQQGYHPFTNKKHAERAAKMVIKKLKNNKTPALTQNEINSIVHS